MDFKKTLNLPKTDFPMKASLPKREPEIFANWQELDIYQRILDKSLAKSEKYILHDGPPYANGDIHIGHALNKNLKDVVVKYKTMKGYYSPYVPGWDCHGLPVEHQLFKELKIKKTEIDQVQFRKKAHDYAMRFVNIQKEQFKRLGIFGDWENPYLTLRPEYEQGILSSFLELVKKGYIYRGLKPVNWCCQCETALAEAEVEYKDHVSPSVYVKFKLIDSLPQQKALDAYLVIWTTTPWTLAANVAVCLHPEFDYCLVETEMGRLVIAKDLLPQVTAAVGFKNCQLLSEFKGAQLEGLKYKHPWISREGKVVLGDHVCKLEGTGLVHTAPGHGQDDYITGLKYKLDIIMPVDARGKFDETVEDFSGMHVYKANPLIIEKLKDLGLLLLGQDLSHSYPHCWRCKKPIIFRSTKQWFVEIDKHNLRENLFAAINKDVEWVPVSGKERISAMIKLRPDWCLSRQRYWGVPIPAVYCKGCKEDKLYPKVIENFIEIVAQEGTDAWFRRNVNELLPSRFSCPDCGESDFSKTNDILDVWFDSGVSHQAVLKKRPELRGSPCELYLEGSDQHRGWFQTSLIPSVAIDGKPPFKTVLTHGFVVDGEGRKMSKSIGNVISPQNIIKDYGADILRLWVVSSDYNEDIRISSEILARLSEAYRKIRNTARFILSNLFDFDPNKQSIEDIYDEDLKSIDKWILFRLNAMLEYVSAAYENFEFANAYKRIYSFCNEELSMLYLDMIKGRLYTYAADSPQRRAAQGVIYEVLSVLVRVMAPILVFTAEEIWQHLPKRQEFNAIASVHLLDWPQQNNLFAQAQLRAKCQDIDSELNSIIELIPVVGKALEAKRNQGMIGSSFDARIILLTSEGFYYKNKALRKELCEIYKVSDVSFEIDKNSATDLVLKEVQKADGEKCVRCWNWSCSVGENKQHPEICQTCCEQIS